jgi:tRNA nucleotidyltransferase/poly(A) polymerase
MKSLNFNEYVDVFENKNFHRLIPPFVRELANEFQKRNRNLYVVGGAIRDFLQRKKPQDFDLATDALPNEVEDIVTSLGHQTIPVGRKFGIVIAVDSKGEEYEIATFREDLSGGRRPDGVKFTTIEGDVKRRDFTINALFYDLQKDEIVDLVGGVLDLESGVIRTVGKPEDRFEEDALRKLRALRFLVRSGEKLDDATKKALQKDATLKEVSSERIYEEFKKAIKQARNPEKYIQSLFEFGFMKYFFPDLKYNTKTIKSGDHRIQAAWILQNNDTAKISKQLNRASWSRDDIGLISFLIRLKNSENKFEEVYPLIRKKDQTSYDPIVLNEWINLFPNKKDWMNKVLSFDLNLIDMNTLKDSVSDPSKMPQAIQTEIQNLW